MLSATQPKEKPYATLGEICDALRDVFGIYEEVAIT